MQQEQHQIEAAVGIITLVLLILGCFIVMVMLLYRRKRNRHIIEKINIEALYRQEILKTQLEVQEDTLAYISRELHDNINQVLSFVKLNLGLIKTKDAGITQQIAESRNVIGDTINDLRDLSQSLSFERIARLGLVKSIAAEAEKIEKSGILRTEVMVSGTPYSLGRQRELVFFRIFQEALSNIFKHAGAKNLTVSFNYAQNFKLVVADDGQGFLQHEKDHYEGAGLKNIITRAKLVGAEAFIASTPANGCRVTVVIEPGNIQFPPDE